MEFDLMRKKPSLDIPTLNYIWDEIWRMNAVSKATNERKRGEQAARIAMMKRIEDIASSEQAV